MAAHAVTVSDDDNEIPEKTDVPALSIAFLSNPFTFVEVPGNVQLWHASERSGRGVYLWCIEPTRTT